MKKSLSKIFVQNYLISLVFLFLSGCGIWENFTTYFNTYYNADEAFLQAEEIIKAEKKSLFEFRQLKPPLTTSQPLQKVIEKCSNILQFNAESAYADDALLLIGKAFYYRQEYLKAQRKFQELLTLTDSDLLLESKLWLGKTELQQRNYEEGKRILTEVQEEALIEDEEEILTEAFIMQISFELFNEDYSATTKLIENLLEVSDNDELNATIAYELGKIYLKLEDYESAGNAFLKVQEYSPDFETEFYSQLEYAKILKLTDNYNASFELLEELKSKNRYKEFQDVVELEIALVYYKMDEIEETIQRLVQIDSTYKKTESVGRARFLMGEIFDNRLDFDSAKFFYDKVVNTDASNELKVDAKSRSIKIEKYYLIKNKIIAQNVQLNYASSLESFQADSLLYIEYLKQDSIYKAELLNNPEYAEENLIKPEPITKPVMPTISADSILSLKSNVLYELANYFYVDMDVPDSAIYYYNDIKDNYKNSMYYPNALYALAGHYSSIDKDDEANILYNEIYDNYKYSKIINDVARKIGKPEIIAEADTASELYSKAEIVYLDSNFQTAIEKFYEIYSRYPKSDFAAKSLYTIGWIYENELEMSDSAGSIYKLLVEKYKDSQYAKATTLKLSGYQQELQRLQAVQDSINNAQQDSVKIEEEKMEPEEQKDIYPEKEVKDEREKDIITEPEKEVIPSREIKEDEK
ncbi:MAG: hypothetical protein JXA68_09895 [Ignavibacteriales bacterium]|nr:hypothetical protein [Ignavibacteriales bacterium]